jgi:hypothetical protein
MPHDQEFENCRQHRRFRSSSTGPWQDLVAPASARSRLPERGVDPAAGSIRACKGDISPEKTGERQEFGLVRLRSADVIGFSLAVKW